MKKNLLFGLLFMLSAVGFAQTIDNAFFDKVNYRGAFGATDWTAGWSNYNPQNTVYPATETTLSGDITFNMTLGSPLFGSASFVSSHVNNSFFDKVDYVGAFGKTDWTSGWSNYNPQNTAYPAATVTISGNITTNTTWTSSQVYLLSAFVRVKSGAVLTIEPGTVIRGDKNTTGALIIEPGAQLIANGTAANPIVFTSNQAAGGRSYGDWGGLVLAGNAPTNRTNPQVEGGINTVYGGSVSADNSGSLKYVRIEFPGVALTTTANSEINGLTMCGVGSGTTIDYVQVSYSGDDSFEWFGGTVNAKHLIAYRGWDDDFDTDFGYVGNVQFGVSLRDPAISDQSTSNSFESDNHGTSPYTGLPETAPVFSNISSFGPLATTSTVLAPTHKYGAAMHLRRNTSIRIYNSLFAGWPKGLIIDAAPSQQNAIDGDLVIKNVVMSGCTTNFTPTTPWSATDEQNWYNTTGFNNSTITDNASLALVDPFNLSTPVFTTKVKSYLLNAFVRVKSGAVLTIEPGTIIRGDKATTGALIIEPGAQLIANGTAANPIVFTSNQAAGGRSYGDWGGLVLAGNAPTNRTNPQVEGGINTVYGGSVSADNSGSLKYVRIEFPGVALTTTANSEINGLTMCGVGSGTTIDYVQVSYSGDDSFEWFGGTVNAKHLIAYRGWDDDFDTDFGYVGNVQFGVSLRDPAISDQSTSNSFESDNHGTSPYTGLPETAPIFSNISSFGPLATSSTVLAPTHKYGAAMHLRRNTSIRIYNSLFAGWPKGLIVDAALSQQNAIDGDLIIKNVVMSGCTTNFAPTSPWTATEEQTWFNTTGFNNSTIADNASLALVDPFTLSTPNFLPKTTSMLKSLSYWNTNVATYANNMPIVARAYVNGAQLTAAGSKLIASKNGVVRGWATIGGNNLFSLSAGSATATESDLDLELYDASTQKSYSLPTSFNFNSASSFGTVGAPVDLQATASLTIPVSANGYTWISFNVLPENTTPTNVLNYTATSGDLIFSQSDFSEYVEGEGWFGFDKLEKNKMYVLKTSSASPGSINVTNEVLVKNSSVEVKPGYSWLGYSLLEPHTANEALAGLTLNDADQIFTQLSFDEIYGGTWAVDVELVPGAGFKVSSTAPQFMFEYPTNKIGSAVKAPTYVKDNSAAPTSWIQPSNMQYNAALKAQIFKDNVLYEPIGLTLAVFKDGVCRGVKDKFTTVSGKNMFFLAYASNLVSESGFNFKVYDPTNGLLYDATETVDFTNSGSIGTITAPQRISISTTSVKNILNDKNFSVYPNPVNDVFQISLNSDLSANAKIDLYDLQGKLIQTIYNGLVNNNTLKVNRDMSIGKGLYMLRATVGDKQYNAKVILN